MKGKSVFQILKGHFTDGEYVVMKEVSDTTGGRNRSLDFMAVSLWPSRGLNFIGIEMKRYRNDWLSELKNPAKQENHFKYCDNFYLLTTDESICKPDEIPETWGWMTIKSEKIFIKKKAPKLSPLPLSKHIVCAMLRRADAKENYIHIDSIEERIELAKSQGESNYKLYNNRRLEDYEQLRRSVDVFEEKSGVRIEKWGDSKIGSIVKLIKSFGIESIKNELERMKTYHENSLRNIELAVAETENILTQPHDPHP